MFADKRGFPVLVLFVLLLMTGASFAATSIPFTVNMSEAVNVTGTPRIAVDVGGVTRYATYASGTGTSALTFNYDMVAGDLDLDGVTLTSPIDLNGGTLTDLNGNNATLTFTVPNTSNVKINYPSLGMDFTSGTSGRHTLNGTVYNTLSSFLTATGGTFTRASIGTYFDSSGVMQTATTNTPRFDYDPATLAAKGILIEENRTNSITNSTMVGAVIGNPGTPPTGWAITSSGGLTRSIDSTGVEFGMNYIDVRYAGTTTGTQIQIATGGTTAAAISQQWTFSFYSKLISGSMGSLSAGYRACINENNAGGYLTEGCGTAVAIDSQLRRLSVSRANTNAATTNIQPHIKFTPLTGQNLNFVIRIYATQLERGAFPTSFIPTTTAAVTRQPDDLRFTTASGWFSGTTGTWYAFFDGGRESTQTTNGRVISYDGSTAALSTDCASTSTLGTWNQTTNVCQATGVDFYTTAGGAAVSYNQTTLNRSLSGRGLAPVTGAYTGTYNSTGGVIRLGSNVASNTNILNGHIQKMRFYPARVSDAQLQLLTQ